jgi:hypothetical protein
MSSTDRVRIAQELYHGYVLEEREMVERHLAKDFKFYSPADVGIDLERYWERCWPNAAMISSFELKRIIEQEDEVVVTYEASRTDGSRFRNTEVLTFDGQKIAVAEVYFGWNLD